MAYKVIIMPPAKRRLEMYVSYTLEKLKNRQAARAILEDAKATKNCWFAFEQSGGLFGGIWKAVCIGEETAWNRIKSGDIVYCEEAIKDIKRGGSISAE